MGVVRGVASTLALVGILAFLAWAAWSFSDLPLALKCNDIRSEYLKADAIVERPTSTRGEQTSARIDRQQAEARFNAAGCEGSILNTFLPAHKR